jgi:hypothetical protein
MAMYNRIQSVPLAPASVLQCPIEGGRFRHSNFAEHKAKTFPIIKASVTDSRRAFLTSLALNADLVGSIAGSAAANSARAVLGRSLSIATIYPAQTRLIEGMDISRTIAVPPLES